MDVLVVESQVQLRVIVRRMLEKMRRFDVVAEAGNVEDAWGVLTQSEHPEEWSLVLCSLQLAAEDGITLLKRCREDAQLHMLPFVMTATSPSEATIATVLGEWGADDLIVKPFSYETLERRIQYALKRTQSPQMQLYRLATELKRTGEVEDALQLIGQVELDSKLFTARLLNLKGECLAAKGDVERAVDEFKKSTDICGIYVEGHKNYASHQLNRGNVEEAISALRRIEEIGAVDNDRTLLLGKMLLQTGQAAEAKTYIDRAVRRLDNKSKDKVLREVADMYLDKGHYSEAEDAYGKLVKRDHEDVDALNRMGIALRQQGKYEEAEKHYLGGLRAFPHHAGLHHNMGVLYVAWKKYDKAEQYLRRALKLNPDAESTKAVLEKVVRFRSANPE